MQTNLTAGKSPLQKVRVGDVDQRVWNDDDDPMSVIELLNSSQTSGSSTASFEIMNAQVIIIIVYCDVQ